MAGVSADLAFPRIAADLERAIEWIRELGVRVEHTRLSHYLATVRDIATTFPERRFPGFWETGGPRQLVTCLFEATEVVEVFRAFSGDQPSPELLERVRAYAKGPSSYSDEVATASSNRARNRGLELVTVARLRGMGLEAGIDADGDAWLAFEGRRFFLECKRPQDENGLRKLARKGLRQLASRYGNSVLDARGLLVISATKMLNPDMHAVVCDDHAALAAHLRREIAEFDRAYARHWLLPTDRRTLGVVIEYSTPALVGHLEINSASAFTMVYITAGMSPGDLRLIRSLSARFEAGPKRRG